MKFTTLLALTALGYFLCCQIAIGLGKKWESAQKERTWRVEQALADLE